MSKHCFLEEVPPMGEMNHGIGLCYCHLCTCGEHKCPGDYNKNQRYLKSSMVSDYKKNFTKKPLMNSA